MGEFLGAAAASAATNNAIQLEDDGSFHIHLGLGWWGSHQWQKGRRRVLLAAAALLSLFVLLLAY